MSSDLFQSKVQYGWNCFLDFGAILVGLYCIDVLLNVAGLSQKYILVLTKQVSLNYLVKNTLMFAIKDIGLCYKLSIKLSSHFITYYENP